MKVVLISGATGVGTTSIASNIAKHNDILYIVGTDILRESARQLIVPEVNPYLHRSTYLAGKSGNYDSKSEEVQQEKIIRGFKTQNLAVKRCIDGVIKRYLKEDSSIIIEGIHLVPGSYNQLIEEGLAQQIVIDIDNADIHLERIKYRTKNNPTRGKNHEYNFKEIRWIRDYLLKKANENNTPIIDNSGSLEYTVAQCLSIIH